MKKEYEKPLIEIEEFEVEDIITLCNRHNNIKANWGILNQQ